MKTAHFIVTIPAGTFHVMADTTNGKNLAYLDFFDKMIIYRYFNPDQVTITRCRAKEAKTLTKGLPVTTFAGLKKYGTFR